MRANNSRQFHFRDIKIPIAKPRIRIAMVQLPGPYPDAKIPVTRADGVRTLEWSTDAKPEERCAKVLAVLDWLHNHECEPDINMVVFPEYSFPCLHIVKELQERASSYNIAIVAGADNISLESDPVERNRSLIIIPNDAAQLYWISKQYPSKQEHEYIQPGSDEKFRFVWSVDGETYWFTVYTCLDFTEKALEHSYLANAKGPGLFIVPMCSNVISDFLLYAAILMRRPGGTATVLCNTVGDNCAGTSAVYCFHSNHGRKPKAALELPEDRQAIGIFDLDMRNLNPPQVTPVGEGGMPPISNSKVLEFKHKGESIKVWGANRKPSDSAARGVINPYLFHLLAKKMRIAFLKVEGLSGLGKLPENPSYESLAVLGEFDLVLSHIDHYEATLFYETERVPGVIVRNGQKAPIQTDGWESSDLPFYEVNRFYKVLGVKVDMKFRDIEFIPKANDLFNIVLLGKDWYASDIPDETRRVMLEKKWIIGNTKRIPGVINALITVSLENRSADLERRLRKFEDIVIPYIVESREVTSAFRGTGHRINVDFLLRVTSNVDSLFGFIESLHSWAEEAKEMITTRTLVVMRRFSDVSIRQSLQLEELPPADKQYAERYFYPWLSDKDRLRANSRPRQELEKLLSSFRRIEQPSREYRLVPQNRSDQGDWDLGRLCNSLARGMLYFFFPLDDSGRDHGFRLLMEVHDYFNKEVESNLSNIIDNNVSEELFLIYKDKTNILSQKMIKDLGYTDKVKLLIQLSKEQGIQADFASEFQDLYETVNLRNILAHSKKAELDDIGIEGYANALEKYSPFIYKYKKLSAK